MSASTNSKAIQLLQQAVEEIRREADEQIAELQRGIDDLRAAGSAVPTNRRAAGIKPLQFRGMTARSALEDYMRNHHPDGRVSVATATEDLRAGGAYLAKTPDRHTRTVILTVRNNPRLFSYDEDTREICLAPTANEEVRPKPRGKV